MPMEVRKHAQACTEVMFVKMGTDQRSNIIGASPSVITGASIVTEHSYRALEILSAE